MRRDLVLPFAALAAGALLGGCSTDGAPGTADPDADPAGFQELYDQGLDRYVGLFPPTATEGLPGGVVSHAFGREDGPVCFTGEPFNMATRDGAGDALMVFLQGGGACAPGNCDAVENAPPGIPGPVQRLGILNAGDADNPARDFDLAYLPYCDGSLFGGDTDVDDDGDGEVDYRFRGLLNLTASIDVVAATYPSPRKILLIGNSAGGFGVHMALPILRIHYPDVPIEMVNDSGLLIGAPGGQAALIDYWGSEAFYPEGCGDCRGEDGTPAGYHSDQLDRDPDLRMGLMSYTQDATLVAGSPLSGEAFEAALLDAVASLEADHPERFRSFLADGDGHTFVLRDFDLPVGGSSPRRWIDDLLDGDAWVSVPD